MTPIPHLRPCHRLRQRHRQPRVVSPISQQPRPRRTAKPRPPPVNPNRGRLPLYFTTRVPSLTWPQNLLASLLLPHQEGTSREHPPQHKPHYRKIWVNKNASTRQVLGSLALWYVEFLRTPTLGTRRQVMVAAHGRGQRRFGRRQKAGPPQPRREAGVSASFSGVPSFESQRGP